MIAASHAGWCRCRSLGPVRLIDRDRRARSRSGLPPRSTAREMPVLSARVLRFEPSCSDTSTAAPASNAAIRIIATSIALPRWSISSW